ncbi:MAG: SDR family NAD(P)-dependent oxidoreductase [Oscillospiraceae bacterium]|nr:SDR family NAD(P)-dependent oxidoreductase [Oscillospiraceae bacterium]
MKNFRGKTAFITGGASGIGLALAEECCAQGMSVVIADIRQNVLDEAAKTLKDWPVMAIALDVTDREAYQTAVDDAEARFGNIHLLVNNAGIGCARGPLWEVSYAQTDLAININLTAALNGIRILAPRMLQSGQECYIVSTASKAALIAVPNCGLYNITKQALIAMTESLVSDFQGTNVGASVFLPGPFESDLGQSSGEIESIQLGTEANPPPQRDVDRSAWGKQLRPASEAAKRILRGVERGDIYIVTHSEFKAGFKERTDAMLRAFPDEKPKEGFDEVFGFLVSNPIFNTQKDVPAL